MFESLKWKVLTAISLLAMGNALANGELGGNTYQAFPNGPNIEIDLRRSVVVLDGHNVLTAKTCGQADTLHCLVAGDFVFAYPKKGIQVGAKWEISGHNFEFVRQVTREILGRKYQAYLIEERIGVERQWHLYSPRFGLLAFGHQGERSSAFLLRGRCGFGSSAACQTAK